MEVRGTLHGGEKIFLAPLEEGGPQVPMELIGQGGRNGRVYGEIGKWKDSLVENKPGQSMRGVWGPDPAAAAEQIASIDAAVAAWVEEAPGDFERLEREEDVAERTRCLADKEEFTWNSILTI